MTKQLTQAQIKQLRVFLADYGLEVKARPNKNSVATWKPKTPAGRKCKARMLYWSKMPAIVGVTSYQVRDIEGQWRTEADGALFDAAVQYQKAKPRPTTGYFND
jgi:hypothetical protein